MKLTEKRNLLLLPHFISEGDFHLCIPNCIKQKFWYTLNYEISFSLYILLMIRIQNSFGVFFLKNH